MENRKCKNPDCKKPFYNRRADAFYCSMKCGTNHRNEINRKSQLGKIEKINLQGYKRLKQLIDEGISQMDFADYRNFNIDVDMVSDEFSYHIESGLRYLLYDMEIQVTSEIVNFNLIHYNHGIN